MAINLNVGASSGGNLAATLKRESDGFFWNNITQIWEANPSFANRAIAFTEAAGDYAGSYTASNAGDLGDAGKVVAYFHNTSLSNVVTGVEEVYVVGGNEVSNVDSISASAKAATALSLVHQSIISVTVASVTTNGFFEVSGDDLSSTADQYNGLILTFATGNNQGISRSASDYNFTNPHASLQFNGAAGTDDELFPSAVQAGDKAFIIGLSRAVS